MNETNTAYSLVGDEDDPKKVGSFTSDSDSVKEIQVSVTKYTV